MKLTWQPTLWIMLSLTFALQLSPERSTFAAANERIPIIVDTDIGSYIDDPFALALVLASPELDLRGVTTVGGDTESRAWMVCRLLSAVGRSDVPVAWGRAPQPEAAIGEQSQYRRHPAVIYSRTARPVKETAVELMYNQLKAGPGKITLLALGPLTNVAQLLETHPDCKPWIKRIVLMGGAVRVGYAGKPPAEAEWNIRLDIKAAKTVFNSGVPLVVVPLDATVGVKLDQTRRDKIFKSATPLTYQLQALFQLADDSMPTLYDAVAAAICFDERFCTMEELRLNVDDQGFTRVDSAKPNARVATSIRSDEFLNWYVERVTSFGQTTPPKPPGNLSTLVPRGGMPVRVHTFEDYETDIEKRWWMSGRAETANVPPGSTRSCRGVLTMDFDGQMGDTRTMYNAVIFNPVPGPPMGPNTRLSFRYWLKGTGTMRVQLYSLSNGYHRYLSVTDLVQGSWQSATVDMTAMRRPDVSGGPLAADERIDDIQFYVDPSAELLIDDIVLYDAAPPDEARPFPKRLLYTGWFDTGKQGNEWPGDFEIVPHQPPLSWKAAKSVPNAELGQPWIRVYLRGQRLLGETTQLRFRYRLTGADHMQIVLADSRTKLSLVQVLKTQRSDAWAETTIAFVHKPAAHVDEIRFVLPAGGELLLDDVLLYESGEE
jgi:purine nucleosidase